VSLTPGNALTASITSGGANGVDAQATRLSRQGDLRPRCRQSPRCHSRRRCRWGTLLGWCRIRYTAAPRGQGK
jgi:hypothetical protein